MNKKRQDYLQISKVDSQLDNLNLYSCLNKDKDSQIQIGIAMGKAKVTLSF